MMKGRRAPALLIGAFAIVLPAVFATGPATAPLSGDNCSRGNITVPGIGVAFSTTDEALIDLVVSNFNFTATSARDAAANTAEHVVQAIRKVPGISQDNITTTSLSVLPEHDGNEVIGYNFSHEISVGVSNVTDILLASVLDSAVDAGSNRLTIKSVSYYLSAANSYDRTVESRRVAAKDAVKTASQLASNLGVTLGRILTIKDTTQNAEPKIPEDATAVNSVLSAPTGATPISIARLRTDTSIEVVFALC